MKNHGVKDKLIGRGPFAIKTIGYALLLAASVDAATYAVKVGGGGDYTTIQACAAAMSPGDNCTVFAGTYNENVTVTAGTSGNYKTLSVNGSDIVNVLSFTLNSHTQIIGFHIQNPSSPNTKACVSLGTATDVYITSNVITECGSGAQITTAVAGASHVYISGNQFSYGCFTPGNTGACYAMSLNGNHFFVRDNDASHVWIPITYSASYSVFRSNKFHDLLQAECANPACHSDLMLSEPSLPVGLPAQYNLIEGNTGLNIVGTDAKGYLSQGDSCAGQCYNLIIRFNSSAHMGSGGVVDDNAQKGAINPGFYNVKSYNNTWIDTNTNAPSFGITENYSYNSIQPGSLNNLFYYPVALTSFNPYASDSSTNSTFTYGHNLGYCTVSPCNLKGHLYNSGSFSSDPGNIVADPKFVNYAANDFRLGAGSPAIGAGTYLTTVAVGDSGSGTSLVVNDASFFQDGYGISGVNADCISVTTVTNHVCVTGINYQTNTLTLANPTVRSASDRVWLYSDSAGRTVLVGNAPNIGAAFAAASAPPTSVTVVVH